MGTKDNITEPRMVAARPPTHGFAAPSSPRLPRACLTGNEPRPFKAPAAKQQLPSEKISPAPSKIVTMVEHEPEPKRFSPKIPVQLDPPKYDPITVEELSKCDGTDPNRPTLVAIKGIVFDVTRNQAYSPSGQYHVFAGKDPSRALASSSLKPEDCRPDWYDLEDKEKTVLDEWFTFFSKRYNIVGKVQDATNY
ncbi:hypothetical protein AbraIFM66950_004849 [Aspergillus brasiliensis]|nr:hypothetical protein AbraIFM66950_004849 [Aspergillus brasiliensis]